MPHCSPTEGLQSGGLAGRQAGRQAQPSSQPPRALAVWRRSRALFLEVVCATEERTICSPACL